MPPRTSGITQKAHENEQPSWIFTNARTRSRRCSAWTHAIAPTSPATNAAAASPTRPVTTTFDAQPVEGARRGSTRSRSRRRRSPRERPRERLARLRDRLVRDAARVDDRDLPSLVDLRVPVREQALPRRLGVGERDLAAEEARREGGHRRPEIRRSRAERGRPPSRRARRRRRGCQPGWAGCSPARYPDVTACGRPGARGSPRTGASSTFATATSTDGSALAQGVGDACVERDVVERRVGDRHLDRDRVVVDGRHRARSRVGPPRSRARPSRSRRRAGCHARGRASSSTQSRVVGCAPVPNARPGSITTAGRSTAAAPTAGRSRPRPRRRGGGTPARRPPSPMRRAPRSRREHGPDTARAPAAFA